MKGIFKMSFLQERGFKQKIIDEISKKVVNQLMESQKRQEQKNQEELFKRLENWEKEVRDFINQTVKEELTDIIDKRVNVILSMKH